MHFEASVIVKAPREKVYSAFTDFESGAKWSKDKSVVRVSRREGNRVYLETATKTGAAQGAREMILFPPERIESGREIRFTRTKSVVKFDEVPEGTRVTASLDVQVKGRWSWVFKTQGRAEAEATALDELNSFARYVESLP